MEVLIILAFVSVSLAATAIVLFGHSARARHYDFADRLALMPMEDDEPKAHTPTQDPKVSATTERTES